MPGMRARFGPRSSGACRSPPAPCPVEVRSPRACRRGERSCPMTRSPADLPQKKTVLVAEDEDALRALMVLVLSGMGYAVLSAHDGPQAVRLAQQSGPGIDVVVTDVELPGLSGVQVADRLVAARP